MSSKSSFGKNRSERLTAIASSTVSYLTKQGSLLILTLRLRLLKTFEELIYLLLMLHLIYHKVKDKIWDMKDEYIAKTRMHSNRMHTTRSLTVSPSMQRGPVWPLGGACLVPGGCLPGLGGGCLHSPGGGACLVLGGGIPACTEAPPLWTEWQTPMKI